MISANSFHGMQLDVELMARPEFGDKNVIKDRTDHFRSKHVFLVAQWNPLKV